MKSVVKRLVVGTALEAPLKRFHSGLTGNRNSLYDWQTIAVLRRVLRPDSNAIDVGAFEGGMLRHMIRLAPRGRHIAVEPVPERAAALAARFPTVSVHAVALGPAPGESEFQHVVNRPALSGLRRRSDIGVSDTVAPIRVRVETLDRLAPSDRAVAFVKIDVEGGELGVIRGGVETLRRWRPIVVFECGLGAADAYGVEPEEVHEIVAGAAGLQVSLLQSWLDGGRSLTREAFAEEYRLRRNFYFIAHP